MSTPNFSGILNKQASAIKPPPLLPVANYILCTAKIEQTVSSKKGTPGALFTYAVEGLAPGEAVDLKDNDGNEIDLSKKFLRDTFWLTDDALHRLTTHLSEILGIDLGTMTIAEILNNYTQGTRCIGNVTQKPSDKGTMFNEIASYARLS